MPDNLKPEDPSNPYADYMESQMHEFLMGHELRRPPGQHEYSNYGMGLLGQVLARQLGRTYEQCLVEQICKPLGMHDTRITLNEDQYKRLASPYNGALKLENTWDFPALAGAGGIRSTCNDMIKFIQLTPQFALTVTVEGGKLMVQATGQDRFQVFAESKTKFFYKVVDAQISFVPDQNGKINHVILHQGGLNQKAARKN